MKKLTLILPLGALLFFGAGCSKTSTNTSSANVNSVGTTNTNTAVVPTTENAVGITNFAFSPASITVKAGTTVTWTNNDSVAHTIVGDNGGPSSGSIAQGGTYSYVFNTAGTLAYHCSIHPSMTGTVTVTP
jgi:plastocyanin